MKLKIVAIQFGATETKERNLKKARKFLDSLITDKIKPDFICLPELFSYLPNVDDDFDSVDKNAEEITGITGEMFSEYARRLKTYIISGSFIERRDNNHYNTSLLFGPDGAVLAKYSKIHLFDTIDFKESWFVKAGNKYTVIDTEFCKIGMIICYDLRFPELIRSLALKGAEIIFCPAAFPMPVPSPGVDH